VRDRAAPSGGAAAEDANLPGTLPDYGHAAAAGTAPERVASGEPGASAADAQAILAAGIQDISNSLVDEFSLNDTLRIILETMYRALGFHRVLLCVREARGTAMAGRFGFGPGAEEVARRFRFPLGGMADVFNIVLAKGVDLLVHDATDAKIAGRIPEWYRKAAGAPSFILLPLTMRNSPVGLIYADKDQPNAIVISEKELSLLRTLRNQAVLAIKQSS
jgi:transcriptional regulator with GAF, ATPase, and Fis domain